MSWEGWYYVWSKTENYITYEEAVNEHSDVNVIINTTPSGMYPDCEGIPIDISSFNELEGVMDAVYNPLCTNLVLRAKEKGIKAEGGLYMLVAQAAAAVEKFIETDVSEKEIENVYNTLLKSKENIVLIAVG